MIKSVSIIFLSLLIGGCSTNDRRSAISSEQYSAIIRLTKNGHFFCSAFVISRKHAVTAAHCVQSEFLGVVFSKLVDVDIANSLGDQVTTGKVVGANSRIDYALIEGDFQNFKRLIPDYTYRVYKATEFAACGYPQNSKTLRCSLLFGAGTRFFQIRTTGELVFGGHSGGPVFDLETGKVVGVVSAVDDGGVLFAPIIELPSTFNLPRSQ